MVEPAGATRRPDPVHSAQVLIAERWTSLILREAFFGVRRFDDFQRNLKISRAILSERLRGLVDAELFERRQYQEHPPRFEYMLTERGLDLWPVFLALQEWGERWLPGGTARAVLRHETCGREVRAAVVCSECGEPLRADEIVCTVTEAGPEPGQYNAGGLGL